MEADQHCLKEGREEYARRPELSVRSLLSHNSLQWSLGLQKSFQRPQPFALTTIFGGGKRVSRIRAQHGMIKDSRLASLHAIKRLLVEVAFSFACVRLIGCVHVPAAE